MRQGVATETTTAMTKAPAIRVEVMETTPAQAEMIRAPRVEGMEGIQAQAEMTRAPQAEGMEAIQAQAEMTRALWVEGMEAIQTQEVVFLEEIRAQVECKASLNRREYKLLRALPKRKDGRRLSLPLGLKQRVALPDGF